MEVKGMTYKGREVFLVRELGLLKWEAFVQECSTRFAFLQHPVLASTLIPAADFLAFNDLIIERFFKGDPMAYWTFGEKSAEWALTEGPYKVLLGGKDVAKFTSTLPLIWMTYFTEGQVLVTGRPGSDGKRSEFDLQITGVTMHHLYFEYLPMGYIAGGMKLAGAEKVEHERVRGFSRGDDDVLYRFTCY